MIKMVRLYRASEAEDVGRAGYSARYIADIEFRNRIENGGFILVSILAGTTTTPHAHAILEEVFIALSRLEISVSGISYHLEPGDIVLAEPGEPHYFSAHPKEDGKVLAIKLPNLKDDKI
jgi:quercetin dioxygenase-like cupin family protein